MSDIPMPMRKSYPTDLTDAQWALIEPFVRASTCGPQEMLHPRREVVNAILYILHTGAQWRYMPHDLPDWQLIYHYFNLWKKDGTWKKLNDALRVKVRKKAGREAEPTASILDSQSVKTTEEAETKGYDAGKEGEGQKAPPAGGYAGPAAAGMDNDGGCAGQGCGSGRAAHGG